MQEMQPDKVTLIEASLVLTTFVKMVSVTTLIRDKPRLQLG